MYKPKVYYINGKFSSVTKTLTNTKFNGSKEMFMLSTKTNIVCIFLIMCDLFVMFLHDYTIHAQCTQGITT